MKAAFALFHYFPFGGLERDMLQMARCAAARGHEVTICTGQWTGEPPGDRGVAVRIVPLTARSNHGRAVEFSRKFADLARESDFDVTVGFNRIPGCDFYFAADHCYAVEMPKKHAKLVLRLLPRYRAYLKLEREVFAPEAATRIFTLTPRQQSDYSTAYRTQDARFYPLPPGIDAAFGPRPDRAEIRRRKRRELGLKNAERMLTLIGSNFRLKGGDRAVAALAALPEDLRRNCRLFAIGAFDPRIGAKAAEAHGVSDRVVLLGGRDDVPELLAATDLLIHPARNEAAGNVLVEAIASGVPVIASGVCGFSSFVAAAGGMVLPEPFEQSKLNSALREMLENLTDFQKKVAAYAEHGDFHRRADTAVDLLERFSRGEIR